MKAFSRRSAASTAAVVVAIALGLSGCSSSDGGSDTEGSGTVNTSAVAPTPPSDVASFGDIEPGSGKGLKIGFTQLALSSPFPKALQDGMEAAATTAGFELITCDSKLDAAKALDCARQFKTQGVDGLITFQADAASSPAICKAGPQVPVLAVDIVQDPCQTAFVGAANEYAGEIIGYNVAKYFADEFECDYDAFISLESTAVGEVNDQRMGGIKSAFEDVCGPIHDLRVVDTGAGGQADTAQKQVTDTLTALPGAKKVILVGINEDVVVGALAAARSQGREDDLYLGVQNLDPTNCQILTAKHWVGSAAYFPEKYAELLVPNLIKAIKGEEIADKILVPHEFVTADTIKDFYPEYSC